MKIDASNDFESDFDEGVILGEVKNCEVKHSKKNGDPYFNVHWHDAGAFGAGKFVCFDIVMLAGKGRTIGIAKLKALGFQEVKDEASGKYVINADAVDLIGRRAWLNLGWEEFERADGTTGRSLKVRTEFEPTFKSGCTHENTPPPEVGKSKATAPIEDDESIPF